MIDNINKPNPKHYKLALQNIPVVIDGEEKIVDSLHLETRYILKDIVNEANMTHEQAAWYWSIGKRYFRLCKKHDNPATDIKKIIQESTFLLSSILGKEYKAHLIDEDGCDLLNDYEEIATIDKLTHMLNNELSMQEKDIIKKQDVIHFIIDGKQIPINRIEAKNIISKLGEFLYD